MRAFLDHRESARAFLDHRESARAFLDHRESARALRDLVPAPARFLLVSVLGRRYRRQVAGAWR